MGLFMGLLKVSGVNEKMVDDKVIHIIHRNQTPQKIVMMM